jgi:nucleoside phosphorylase
MIAVTFALPTESSEFLKGVSNKSQSDRNGIRLVRGSIDDRTVEVLHTGVGENICRERIGKFLEDAQFHILISTGFAGALNDESEVGDLLLAKNFSTIDLNRWCASFSKLQIRTADLLTSPDLIDSADKRNRIARASGAAAADMETEFIAQACAAHGIPLLSLRVITDTPRTPFPAPAPVLFDIEHQRPPMAALTMFFLAHPKRIPRLIAFTRRIARARKTLSNALIHIVREL